MIPYMYRITRQRSHGFQFLVFCPQCLVHDELVSPQPVFDFGSIVRPSQVVVTSQKPEEETQSAGGKPVIPCQQKSSTPGGFGGEHFENGCIPSAQGVLNFIAFKYFQTVDPSKPEESNGYLQYLKDARQVLFVDAQTGGLVVTVLEGLWNDYSTGHLNEMAQRFLVTDSILKEFGLTEGKLTSTTLMKEYKACREHLLLQSGN